MGREQIIPADEQALALATKRAVQAAGGLEVCARETGLSTSQLSRCCMPTHRDSLSIRDAHTIEAIAHGAAGHPHISRALASMAGYVLVRQPQGMEDADGLMRSVIELTSELGDVSHSIAAALSDDAVSAAEAHAALKELDELDVASANLRLKLWAIAEGEKSGGRGRA